MAVLALCITGFWAQSSEFEGKTVVVFEPSFNSEEQADAWIPSFVQGIVSTNFQKYSNMKVIDRQNIDRVIKEQKLSESLSYSEDGQIEIGKLLAAQYIVAITVIKKSNNGYSIEYKITNTETGAIGGSYIDTNCIESDMNDGSAINNDCRELLLAIGINESNLSDLSKANIQKQKAEMLSNEQLARGIAAEKAGNLVEAISFYQKAQNTGFGIAEAISRLQSTTSTMVSGGIDADVAQIAYDEIAQLNKETDQWIKVWSDFRDLFQKSSVIVVYYYEELPNPKRELGSTIIEYNDIKYSLKCKFEKELYEVYRVIDNAFKSVNKERLAWYFDKSNNRGKLRDFVYSINPIRYRNFSNEAWFEISIVNSNDKTIATYKRDVRIPFDKFLDYEGKVGETTQSSINLKIDVVDYTDPLTLRVEVYNGKGTTFKQAYLENNGVFSQELFRDMTLDYKTIKEYTIPDYITAIDKKTFEGCELLEKITIPKTVMSIGDEAFYKCNKLYKVYYAGSLKDWINISFGSNPLNITYYRSVGFQPNIYMSEDNGKYFKKIRQIKIPDGIIEIKANTFSGFNCDSVSIPKSVVSIGAGAFEFSHINDFYYDGSLEEWTQISFYDVYSNPLTGGSDNLCFTNKNISFAKFTRLEMQSGLTAIGSCAFVGLKSLKTVIVPDGVKSIGNSAFWCCESLKNVVIPDGVKSIGNSAFFGCKSLKTVVIPKSVASIGHDAFWCNSLKKVTVLAETPPVVGTPLFSKDASPTIFVPKESVEKYKQAWKGVVDPKRIKAIR